MFASIYFGKLIPNKSKGSTVRYTYPHNKYGTRNSVETLEAMQALLNLPKSGTFRLNIFFYFIATKPIVLSPVYFFYLNLQVPIKGIKAFNNMVVL